MTAHQHDLFLDAGVPIEDSRPEKKSIPGLLDPAQTVQMPRPIDPPADPTLLPFRTTPDPGVPEDVDALNERYGFSRAAALEPVDAAIERIRSIKNPSASRLWSWVLHPDERVPVALLDSGVLRRNCQSTYWAVSHIYGRGLDLAATERNSAGEAIVWNPLLDAVARNNLWPHPWEVSRYSHDAPKDDHPYAFNSLEHVKADEAARTLAPWIRTCSSEEELLSLLPFASFEVLNAIATYATCLTPQSVERILTKDYHIGPYIAENKRLSPETEEYLKAWAIWAISHISDLQAKHPAWQKHDRWQGPGAKVLAAFLKRSALSEKDFDILLDTLEEAAENEDVDTLSQVARFISQEMESMPEGVLVRAIPHLHGRSAPYYLRRYLKSPECSLLVARTIAVHNTTSSCRTALAETKRFIEDPVIWNALSKSVSKKVMPHLLDGADKEEFPRFLRKVARIQPDHAARVLEDRIDEVSEELVTTDLLPLLEADTAEARITALKMVSRVGERGQKDKEEETPESPPKSRGRTR